MNTTEPAFTNGLIVGMFLILAIQIAGKVLARFDLPTRPEGER